MRPAARAVRMRDYAPGTDQFLDDVLTGLSQPEKKIPCKYFYDERGSALFEKICDLDEYYLTRTEMGIMERHVGEMADALGPDCLLIEYGSGSGMKTRLLLEALETPAAYVPIDISSEALAASARQLAVLFPSIEILPVCADYTAPFQMPVPSRPVDHRAVFFPGSTIGNFAPGEARRFLSHVARVVGRNGGLLIGTDLKKDRKTLEAAYDDADGVTAEFNKNLLVRMNRELGADFDLDRFDHRAVYNVGRGRVEIYLVSRARQSVRIGDETIRFGRGETIHTEYSHKFDLDGFRALAAGAGFEVRRVWTDPDRLFAVQHLVVP